MATSTTAATHNDPTGLNDDLPPAYTPGPDVRHGESTVEYGPQRPFQPAPPRPAQQPAAPLRPQPQSQSVPSIFSQLIDTLTTQLTGPTQSSHPTGSSSWSGYPGQQLRLQPNHTGYGATPYSASYPSPAPPALPPRPSSASDTAPTSDFARDFYAACPGSEAQPSSGYAPPPGPPPSASQSSSDGRPTTTPTPGHPLLKDGNNTGYKHADPSHPCKKCWSKYAKPFTGPLAYAFTSETSPPPSSVPSLAGTTLQRPLPSFRPPRHYAPPRPPPPPPVPFIPPPPQHPQHPQLRAISPYTPPPPNAIVYPSGDPRIGGRMCWNCEGRGRLNLLIFELPCDSCRGIGRVFP
ncbi:hypothetical protein H0H81_003187 [Sphagnurus paluster]|uniref:Uncharacterized protein n=1 Tax=Sphagnurus paluster TaxID=117069 RepID=A0A9P7FYY2_9AGAR|nr:hypothetical protein H0H81_003187 [Sphagnurus paluster]